MNKRRLQDIIREIEKGELKWDQMTYHCGTCHCIAGHAQLKKWARHKVEVAEDGLYTKDGLFHSAYHDARGWLGLDDDEAWYLFNGLRQWHEIKTFAKRGMPL